MDKYFFWGKDLLNEFSIGSFFLSGIKSFFLPSNLLFLPAWCFLICWFIYLNRAQFKNWRIFFVVFSILVCAGFGFVVMFFLMGCIHTNRALPLFESFLRWKSYAGPGILLISCLLLIWNLLRPRSKALTGTIALFCAVLSGPAFGLSYIYLLTDDLQFLMRTLTERELILDGMNLLFSHALGMTLPLVLLLALIFLCSAFSKSKKYPSNVFSVFAFVLLLITGILTISGHLGIYTA